MIKKNESYHRRIIGIILGTFALVIAGCGDSSVGIKETTVSLLNNGAVETCITENFEQSYYDKDELQQMILTEVAAYNKQAGGSNIGVEKIEADQESVIVQMSYAKASDYAVFNKVTFFDGSATEAEQAGYDLQVVLSNTKDALETVGQGNLLNMEGVRLIITDIPERIILPGKALYTSDNVTVADNLKSIQLAPDSTELAYIIVK